MWQRIALGSSIVVLIVAVSALTLANDGRDRYVGPYPSVLYYFDAPLSPAAGYRVLTKDMPGGADGKKAYRWARNGSNALVRVAAWRTARQFGASKFPMAIFDLSSENGDTPIGFTKGKAPRGRHPGGSHDGGINLDLGYYMTAMTGKFFSPDFSACTEHFDKRLKPAPKGSKSRIPAGYRDAYQCRGPADRLDVKRQAYFYLQLFQINRQLFGADLLEEIGIDAKIAEAVLKKVQQWATAKKFGATDELLKEMRLVFNSSPYEGWSRFHHHHTHLRLRNIEFYGKHRVAFERLLSLDEQTLVDQLKRTKKPLIKLTLYSYKLGRALQVKILRPGKTATLTGCRYRRNGGKWATVKALNNCFHEFWLGRGPFGTERRQRVEAELTFEGGKTLKLSRELVTPAQPAWLHVSVHKSQFRGKARCNAKQGCRFSLSFPAPALIYLTKVNYRIHHKTGAPILLKSNRQTGYTVQYTPKQDAGPISLVQAEVILSSRYRIRIPLWVGP